MVDHPEIRQRRYPERPLVGVGAVVFKGERILLVKRRFEPRAATWTLPGGLVERGETCRAAAVREVREECAIEIELSRLVDVIDYIERDAQERVRFHYVLVDFEARYVSGELRPSSEILDARWFSKSAISGLVLPPITASFLKEHYL